MTDLRRQIMRKVAVIITISAAFYLVSLLLTRDATSRSDGVKPAPSVDNSHRNLHSGSSTDTIRAVESIRLTTPAVAPERISLSPVEYIPHRIEIRTEQGAPIAGCQLEQVDPRSNVDSCPLGTTDSEGSLSCQLLYDNPIQVVASHKDYATHVATLRSSAQETTIVLRPGGAVTGCITWGSSTSRQHFEELTVVAIEAHRGRYRKYLEDVLSVRPKDGLHVVRLKESDGRFEIKGLAIGVSYVLFASGDGGISITPITARLSSSLASDPLHIEISTLLAALIRTEEISGIPLRVHQDINHNASAWDLESMQDGIDTYVGSLQIDALALLGVPLDMISRADTRDNRVVFGIARRPISVSAPFALSVNLPGYARERIQVALSPPHLGAIPVVRVGLTPLFDEVGSIQVIGVGECTDLLGPFDGSTTAGLLRLRPTSGSNVVYTVPIRRPIGNFQVIDGIPIGEYIASFTSNGWPHASEPAQVYIGKSTPLYAISIPRRGAVALEVIDGTNSPFEGPLTVRVTRKDDKSPKVKFVNFKSPPYNLELLEPGTYEFLVHSMLGIEQLRSRQAEYRVDECQIGIVRIQ